LLEQPVPRLQAPGVELEGGAGLLREHVVEGEVPVVGDSVLQLDPVHGRGLVESACLRRLDLVPDLQLEVVLWLRHVFVRADHRPSIGADRGRDQRRGQETAERDYDSHSHLSPARGSLLVSVGWRFATGAAGWGWTAAAGTPRRAR